jgi:hypothetical protein
MLDQQIPHLTHSHEGRFPMNLEDLEWQHWLAIGGWIVAVLALLVYAFAKGSAAKVPAAVVGTLAGLAGGIGVGVLAMMLAGYHWDEKSKPAGAPQGMVGRGGPGGGQGGGQRGGGQRGGPRGPNYKMVLINLIAKLDQVTAKPLAVELTEEQKKVIGSQLKGLQDAQTIDPKMAESKAKALLKALEKNKETLMAAGFAWPGENPPGPPAMMIMMVPNPTKMKPVSEHLKALQQRVGGTSTQGEGKDDHS